MYICYHNTTTNIKINNMLTFTTLTPQLKEEVKVSTISDKVIECMVKAFEELKERNFKDKGDSFEVIMLIDDKFEINGFYVDIFGVLKVKGDLDCKRVDDQIISTISNVSAEIGTLSLYNADGEKIEFNDQSKWLRSKVEKYITESYS
jgi:hypothetical protein